MQHIMGNVFLECLTLHKSTWKKNPAPLLKVLKLLKNVVMKKDVYLWWIHFDIWQN